MATRFYLPQSGTAPASPAYSASWESVVNATRMPLVTTPTNTALTSRYTDKAAATEPYDSLAGQWVSEPLPAGAVAGTFTLVIGATESTGSRDAFLQCVIRVVSGDGSTVRGTLYAGQTQTVESATSTASNYELALLSFKVRVLTASLTSVTAEAGDRIVVEYGTRACNANTYNNSVQSIIGDNTSASDLPATVDANGSTSDGRPWIEFSQDVFSAPPAEATIGLAATLRRKTAAITLATVAGVSLAATLQPKVAAFDLAGVADERTAQLDATLRPKTAAFALEGRADLHLDATLPRKVGSFSLNAAGLVELGATLRPKTAAFQLTGDGVVLPLGTDTTNRANGRPRTGSAAIQFLPAVVPPPSMLVNGEHRVIRAAAFGPVTRTGLQPTFAVSAATATRERTQIIVGGKDISFLYDCPTPEPGYQLAEPLLWGPCRIQLPQVAAAYAQPGEDNGIYDLTWCAEEKPVLLRRVDAAGNVTAVDYRGFVAAHDLTGKDFTIECFGHGQGRARLGYKPQPLFRDVLDLGRLVWAACRHAGLQFSPRLGPETGIKSATFGGTDVLVHIDELSAKAFDPAGQWTIMPDERATYSMARKDTTTVHWTVFNDDARNVASLRSDIAERPNQIYGSGVTPRGMRVLNGVYPGLTPGEPAPYPFTDNRAFGAGTTDADTDTGDGITVMVLRLWGAGMLSLDDAAGGYDSDVAKAIRVLQRKAGRSRTGVMNPATWAALYDLDTTGYTVRGSYIVPMAEADRVRRYDRSASDAILGRNATFEKRAIKVARPIEFGSGFTRHQMGEFADAELTRPGKSWRGTITLHEGGVLRGDVAPGAVITSADVADVRDIRPGHNVGLPLFGGGILVHVAGVELSRGPGGRPVATLTVDTEARDAMPVWEMIRRDRETLSDPARRRRGNRASGQSKDAITPWSEACGILPDDRPLTEGWNIVQVPGGQEGTVSRVKLHVTPPGADNGLEFICAIFGRHVSVARLEHLVPAPLADANGETWAEKSEQLDRLGALYQAGTGLEPCGYGWRRKSAGAPLTGFHLDDATFSYRCGPDHLIDIAIYVGQDATLRAGRLLRAQLEAGA